MSRDFLEHHHIVTAVVPVGDAFVSGAGIDTESVDMTNYRAATLVIITGAIEDSGISNLVTFEASTDNAQTGATEVNWRRRTQLFATQSVDTWGALTAVVAATGYNFSVNNAVANAVWYGTVLAEEMESALPGGNWLSARIENTVSKTITAGAIWILEGPRYGGAIPVSANN